jgi:putative transposase
VVSGDVPGQLRAGLFSRAAWYRRGQARDQSALRLRIRDLAHPRPRFGYRRLWVLPGGKAGA